MTDLAEQIAKEWLGAKFVGDPPKGWSKYDDGATIESCREETKALAERLRQWLKHIPAAAVLK